MRTVGSSLLVAWVMLATGACARVAPAQRAVVAGGAAMAEGEARLAPALDALRIPPRRLARRAPAQRQCVVNPDAAAFRTSPHALAAWPPPALRGLWGGADPDTIVAWALGSDAGPAPVPESADLRAAIAQWSRSAAAVRAPLRDALRQIAPSALEILTADEALGPPPASATPAEREGAEAEAKAHRQTYCRLAQALPSATLRQGLADLWAATRTLEEQATRLPADAWPRDAPAQWQTADGFRVVVGTPGADTVESGWDLWLDPGGDDEVDAASPNASGAVRAAVDLGGDDHYTSTGGGIAGGVGTLSVLLDRAGDDAYDGARWSVAGVAFGGAILLDRGGDDAYAARSASVAAAFHGTALLLDAAGTDVYTVGVQGEAFAGPGGLAVLWDGGGDDTYVAGGVAPDRGRNPRHSLSLAQGCGFGLRPDAEGGTAVLVDVSGDDRYEGEIFAQGLGYWGGAGLLWDAAGDDSYLAVQYAQGTGLHYGVGVLSDAGGADTYLAGGLAQGCGHDRGIGACTDQAGDDHYAGAGLASGAASAGGLGMFWDGAGDDRYYLNPLTNLGCDASSADRPGFALHVDAGGRDRFGLAGAQPDTSAPARDGALWFTGRAGVAVNHAAE